ncbi:MAG TPA: hypothetical protein IGS17_11940 [Oscillatoriales cyanobacterium M59_W2019_021]|nr:MAG: hypothetical protein D6728_15265 [Cyanobacteria bacterium J055]HIK33800.1 hypothetical protein [Oscillatoriales cyanobacterium M4454_W2019_049]HIK51614.1 hypothetical protein [Oscillatoriales cyanobacterium M59_W2019_021]
MILSIVGDKFIIEWEWFEQLWGCTWEKTLEIPLAHIRQASNEEPPSSWMELRAPGTFIPRVIKAGTYYTSRGKEFWYVTRDRDYLVLELEDEPYNKIVLTVDGSQSWLERINVN